MKKNWYESWFNEDYSLLYPHGNKEEAIDIIRLFENKATTLTDKSVLDMCCGLGRISYEVGK